MHAEINIFCQSHYTIALRTNKPQWTLFNRSFQRIQLWCVHILGIFVCLWSCSRRAYCLWSQICEYKCRVALSRVAIQKPTSAEVWFSWWLHLRGTTVVQSICSCDLSSEKKIEFVNPNQEFEIAMSQVRSIQDLFRSVIIRMQWIYVCDFFVYASIRRKRLIKDQDGASESSSVPNAVEDGCPATRGQTWAKNAKRATSMFIRTEYSDFSDSFNTETDHGTDCVVWISESETITHFLFSIWRRVNWRNLKINQI